MSYRCHTLHFIARCNFCTRNGEPAIHLPEDIGGATALSNSATRASISSSSMDFAEWFSTLSAARTLVDAGVAGSTITFNSVETAALVACWSRAMAWP